MDNQKKYETELALRYKAGDKSVLPELLTSLEPLIQSHANKWKGNLPDDVIKGEATSIVINSLPNFDPNKASLSTFLNNNLKQLSRFVYTHQNVSRLSEPQTLKVSLFLREKHRLRDELGRDPSVTELAEALMWSEKDVEKMQRSLRYDYVESSNVYNQSIPSDRFGDFIEYFYHGLSPEHQVIFEHTIGYKGKPELPDKGIALKIKKPVSYVKEQKFQIAKLFRNHLKEFA